MTRLTAQEIEAIRKRAESATEGPWKWDGDSLTYRKHGMLDPIVWANQYGDITVEEPDAEFIANAREDIPKLLAEIERLRSEVKSTYLALCVLHDINGVTVMNSDSIRVLRKSLLEAII